LTAFIREGLIPHTYRLAATAQTTGELVEDKGPEVLEPIKRWLALAAGAAELVTVPTRAGGALELGCLLAESQQLRGTLVHLESLKPPPAELKSGFESTQHILLNGAALRCLQDAGHRVLVESIVNQEEWGGNSDEPSAKKPDLRVPQMSNVASAIGT